MARWKLMTPHYLNLENRAEWEYTELDRATGKQKKKKFLVPTLLDPNDPADWNIHEGRDGGYIVVSNDGAENAIQFIGDPTPDMMPLDASAKAVSKTYEGRWNASAEFAEGPYGNKLVDWFESEISRLQSQPAKVEIDGMSEMLAAMAGMMKQNQEIMQAMLSKPERRI